jgi:hypothetical protein
MRSFCNTKGEITKTFLRDKPPNKKSENLAHMHCVPITDNYTKIINKYIK